MTKARRATKAGPMLRPLRSIRWTLQLWHAAILLLALVLLGTALYLAVSRAQNQTADVELESAARALAKKLDVPPPWMRRLVVDGLRPPPGDLSKIGGEDG